MLIRMISRVLARKKLKRGWFWDQSIFVVYLTTSKRFASERGGLPLFPALTRSLICNRSEELCTRSIRRFSTPFSDLTVIFN